jgi:UDP-2-acetamido-3-amino-2,3-dideoxy-glucuronate N-acetyltransferase
MSREPANSASHRMIRNVTFGDDVSVAPFTNLYECVVGDRTRIGPFVEIQGGVSIGANCKIQSHTFICTGVTIEDEVFVGHGVIFVNDKVPRATTTSGVLARADDWELTEVRVRRRASIGSGAVVVGGVDIGEEAMVGAGAIVTRDVPGGATVAGNPARPMPGGGLWR